MDQPENLDIPFLLIFGIFGMLLLAMAIIVFFVIYQKKLLAQQESILQLESTYQKKLLHSNIQIQEVERKRIASDLHDSIGSMLSATKLYLNQLQPNQEQQTTKLIKKETLNLLEEIILNVREITQNLAPQSLERFGLIPAVEDICDRINDLKLTEVNLQFNEQRRFATDKEVAIFRILQELLNNSLKHAQAAQIHVQFLFEQNELTVNYMDDGVGFDLTNLKKNPISGIGLIGIESRVNYLHAKYEMETARGQGLQTTIITEL